MNQAVIEALYVFALLASIGTAIAGIVVLANTAQGIYPPTAGAWLALTLGGTLTLGILLGARLDRN